MTQIGSSTTIVPAASRGTLGFQRAALGVYVLPANGQRFPRVQLITVAELLANTQPTLLVALPPYFWARRRHDTDMEQMTLDA